MFENLVDWAISSRAPLIWGRFNDYRKPVLTELVE